MNRDHEVDDPGAVITAWASRMEMIHGTPTVFDQVRQETISWQEALWRWCNGNASPLVPGAYVWTTNLHCAQSVHGPKPACHSSTTWRKRSKNMVVWNNREFYGLTFCATEGCGSCFGYGDTRKVGHCYKHARCASCGTDEVYVTRGRPFDEDAMCSTCNHAASIGRLLTLEENRRQEMEAKGQKVLGLQRELERIVNT